MSRTTFVESSTMNTKFKRVSETMFVARVNGDAIVRRFSNEGRYVRLQAYMKKELGKVVVYTTTSGIVRKTFYNCKKVKQILRTHMVKYDELDLFGDAELQTELRDRLGSTVIQLPQLFIDGQHIGVRNTCRKK